MKSFIKLRSFLILCAIAAGIITNANAHDAKVLVVKGSAQVQLPGQSSSQPLTKDMMVPEGSLITTSAGAQVSLETLPGVVSTIEAESTVMVEKLSVTKQGDTVTAQEAMLDLKKGNLISTLDPSKKAINNYGVRTPKGVAAARGTVFGIAVNTTGTTVATLSGTVTVDLGNGVFADIPVGSGMMTDDQVVALNAAIAASGQTGLTLETLLAETVQAVSDSVALGANSPLGDSALSVLAGVVNAASAASPDNAAAFTSTAVAALVATGGSNAEIAAVTEAASQGATRTLVERAVATFKAANPDATESELEAATQAASNAAQTTVQNIADASFATASAGLSVADAQILAAVIANSATAGARTGATGAAAASGVTLPAQTPIASINSGGTTVVGDASAPAVGTPIITPVTEVILPPVSGS